MTSNPLTPADLDRYAEEYYLEPSTPDLFIEERVQLDVFRLIEPILAGNPSILEMGFGTGTIAKKLLDFSPEVTVVEGSPLLCEAAINEVPRLNIEMSLFETFAPESLYDVVLCLFILEHVDDPVAVISRAASWLNPGGMFVAAVPNAESIHRQVAKEMKLIDSLDQLSGRDHLVGHQRVFDAEGLGASVAAAGLTNVEIRGSFLKPVSNELMLDWSPDLISGLCKVMDRMPAAAAANLVCTAQAPRFEADAQTKSESS